jgi:hypothetical protein
MPQTQTVKLPSAPSAWLESAFASLRRQLP